MLHIFYTNALQATEVGFKRFNISITGRISVATALCVNTFTELWTRYMSFICGWRLRIRHISGLKYFVSAPSVAIFDFTSFLLLLWALEHNWSGPGVFVSVPGLLVLIVHSKAGEHHFVLQPVSFAWVDTEEGVKQLDKMALMCLKNLLSLIKAHTHAAQRQTEQTQFSAPSSERLFSPGFAAALLCAWNQDQFGFVSLLFFLFCFFYFSNVILTDSLPHLLKKGQQGFGFTNR